MARILRVVAPSGIATPSFVIVDAADAVIDTVTLTELTNAKGVYQGPLTTTAVGIHAGNLLDGSTLLGSYDYVRVYNTTPDELVIATDAVGVQDGIKLDQLVTGTHNTTTDTIPVTFTE